MSAYMMSNEDINAIVNYFANAVMESNKLWIPIDGEYNYLTRENAEQVANILYNENKRSVDYRYNETNGFDFTYKPTYKTVSDKEVARLIDSIEYQSCETSDYYTTEAYRMICNMRKNLLQRVFAEEVEYSSVWTD